jgi:hypothetical protein
VPAARDMPANPLRDVVVADRHGVRVAATAAGPGRPIMRRCYRTGQEVPMPRDEFVAPANDLVRAKSLDGAGHLRRE